MKTIDFIIYVGCYHSKCPILLHYVVSVEAEHAQEFERKEMTYWSKSKIQY